MDDVPEVVVVPVSMCVICGIFLLSWKSSFSFFLLLLLLPASVASEVILSQHALLKKKTWEQITYLLSIHHHHIFLGVEHGRQLHAPRKKEMGGCLGHSAAEEQVQKEITRRLQEKEKKHQKDHRGGHTELKEKQDVRESCHGWEGDGNGREGLRRKRGLGRNCW